MYPSEASADELDLRDYLQVIRRRKWIIVAVTVLVAGSALAFSLAQTPVYQGRAELLLQARATETLFNPNTGQRSDPTRALATEIQVLKSRPVRDLVRERIGDAPLIEASGVGQTDVFVVMAESTDPDRAAKVANAYADAYIDFRRTQQVDDLLQAATQIQKKIADLQRQMDALPPIPTGPRAGTDPDVAQRNSLFQQQSVFLQKLDLLQVDAALKSGGAQLVTPAVAPTQPIRPTPKRSGILGVAVGLMLGVGLAFLREFLDDSLKGKDDVERATPGLPVVGLIPVVPSWKDSHATMVVSVTQPKSAAAEAYRTLRTSVQFLGVERQVRTIQITSPGQAEGKSTTIANLAIALASAGRRVVVVDADLRRPRIHEFFGLDNTVGLSSMLLGETDLRHALLAVPGQPNIHLMPSGPIPPNPSELLSTERASSLLARLADHADIVLIDCPPVLPVTDAIVLAPKVDATLLVVRVGKTHLGQLRRAAEMLSQVDAPLIGTVVNSLSGGDGYGYANGYRYAYSAPSQRSKRSSSPAEGPASAAPEAAPPVPQATHPLESDREPTPPPAPRIPSGRDPEPRPPAQEQLTARDVEAAPQSPPPHAAAGAPVARPAGPAPASPGTDTTPSSSPPPQTSERPWYEVEP